MSEPDAVPLPREGQVFFDVRGESRSMRLSWYADSAVAVFSIWQGNRCTGTFRLPFGDLARMVQTLQSGPHGTGIGYGDPGHYQADHYPAGPAAAAGYGYQPAGDEGADYVAGAYEEPGYDDAAYDGPAYDGPAYDGPAYDGPAYDGPAYDGPAYDGAGYEGASGYDAEYGQYDDHRYGQPGGHDLPTHGAGYYEGDYQGGNSGHAGGYENPRSYENPGSYADLGYEHPGSYASASGIRAASANRASVGQAGPESAAQRAGADADWEAATASYPMP